jgi:hypothetical protein
LSVDKREEAFLSSSFFWLRSKPLPKVLRIQYYSKSVMSTSSLTIDRRVWCRFVLFFATPMIEPNKSSHDIKHKTRRQGKQQVKDISNSSSCSQQLCVRYNMILFSAMPIQAPQWTDFLACPVCCNGFDVKTRHPISLGCAHTVCKSCLSNLPKKQCPFDQVSWQLFIYNWHCSWFTHLLYKSIY